MCAWHASPAWPPSHCSQSGGPSGCLPAWADTFALACASDLPNACPTASLPTSLRIVSGLRAHAAIALLQSQQTRCSHQVTRSNVRARVQDSVPPPPGVPRTTPSPKDSPGRVNPVQSGSSTPELKPLTPAQRRQRFREAGIDVDKEEEAECTGLRQRLDTREGLFCDCNARDGCKADTCVCIINGIDCYDELGRGCACKAGPRCVNECKYVYDDKGVEAARAATLQRLRGGKLPRK
jgi:hypothetical protein